MIAHKNIKMRGQAFVVYESLDAAQAAVSSLQSESKVLFDKPLHVSFAKTKSDAIVKKAADEGAEDAISLEQHKEIRLREKDAKRPEFEKLEQIGKSKGGRKNKKRELKSGDSQGSAKRRKTANAGNGALLDDNLPPNKLLLLQNLPSSATSSQIEEIYSKYAGFIEVRLVAPRHLAFVEYETDEYAIVAKEDTQNLKLDQNSVKVTFTKK